ncbi:hypothetical protein SAMN04488074_13629 [Lentzea albidocapillata subsp. violacea]|uniref:Uncharacterized protein n=1 Tax=Lentzea albidocapillata subsp. violacea TaxID=128104 RepID=A0A1G9YY26_9PSEU|nr:hypothetical protein [Lentzea albidocapillata]SDN14109.1 hypothetical protein SAMN04488074_13629 [Lentzea albidocapillata subsp. violacea]
MTEKPNPTRTTVELQTGDEVITPDGTRRGVVRKTYSDGPVNREPGKTTVQLFSGSVFSRDEAPLPRPRGWIVEDNDTEWQLLKP